MFERCKLSSSKDDKQNMLNAEKLLAYDPGNTDHMLVAAPERPPGRLLRHRDVDRPDPAEGERRRARSPSSTSSSSCKDVYKEHPRVEASAVEACQYAAALKPDDMDLQTELKNLGA